MTARRSIAALYRVERDKAESAHAERRQLVLAHDDLAKRLTQQPVGFKEPRQWTGYIPPFMVEGPNVNHRDTWVRNPSPQRVHLVALVREAYARTYGEAAGKAWLDEINTNVWGADWSPHAAIDTD